MLLLLCIATFLFFNGDSVHASDAKTKQVLQFGIPTESIFKGNSTKPTHRKVDEGLKPWNKNYSAYEPVFWNAECQFEECDPQIGTAGFDPLFGRKDGKVNRKPVKGCCRRNTIKTNYGIPLNPAGRTGLVGRGLLPRYGPNRIVSIMFVWESKNGITILKKNPNASYEDGLLTGFVDDSDIQPFPTLLLQEIRESLLKNSKIIGTYPDRIINTEKKHLVRAFGGSVPFSLETDNAWVEWKVFMLRCTEAKVLCDYGLSTLRQKYGLDNYHVNSDINFINKENRKSALLMKYEPKFYTVFCENCPKEKFRVFFKRAAILLAAGPLAAIPLALAALGAVVVGVIAFTSAFLLLPTVIWFSLRKK